MDRWKKGVPSRERDQHMQRQGVRCLLGMKLGRAGTGHWSLECRGKELRLYEL